MNARRKPLLALDAALFPTGNSKVPSVNAGLWLARYLLAQTGEGANLEAKEAKEKLISQAGRIVESNLYRQAFDARRAQLLEPTAGRVAQGRTAQSAGRIVIGIGDKGALEVGLTLEHTWGVPVLPGSALKGLAASAARKFGGDAWQADQPSYLALFGDTDERGFVTFHDAWRAPKSDLAVVALDVMTVHHAEYYGGSQDGGDVIAPADTDSPIPVSFMTVHGDFLVVVEAQDASWCDAALRFLEMGLRDLGIGAKTNAGYGRMKLAPV
jgi:CRISPR-associated protein Cmr6